MIDRRCLLSLLSVVLMLFSVPSAVSAQKDSLTNIGHASMKIKTSDGKVIYIDPYAGTAADYADSADLVLVTHGHSDHNQVNLVKLKTGGTTITYVNAVISGQHKSFTVGNISVEGFFAYNGYHQATNSVGYILTFNGITLYHAGDTGEMNEMANLAAKKITYALLPMDGIYTMTPEDANYAATLIKADYYVPMHTMPPPDTYSDAIVARFTVPNKIILKNRQTVALSAPTTSVRPNDVRLDKFSLDQNYPNPFNPSTRISFTLPASGAVLLSVFDPLGKHVATVVDGHRSAGTHSVRWNADGIPGGVYFYRLSSGTFSETKKMLLLK